MTHWSNAARRFSGFKKTCRFKSLLLVVLAWALGLPPLCSSGEDRQIEPRVSAAELAREVVRNELNAQDSDRSLWQYRQIREEDGKTESFEVVETRDGEVHRLLAVNGAPLTGKQRQNEDRRIQRLLTSPDAEQEKKLLKALPQAFLYEYDGTMGELIKLKFRPNPDFRATNHESEVFHRMEGTMLVDPRHVRLAEIRGQLLTEVKFWDGLLGHLDKGGTFFVKQRNVGAGHWEMTELNVQMNGKALFFKTIGVHEKEIDSDFRPLPDQTTLWQAPKLLTIDTAS